MESAAEQSPDERVAGDPPVAEEGAARIRLACSYCHGAVLRAELAFCASCLGPHHVDCFGSHGSCSLPGCGSTHLVTGEAVPAPRRRWWAINLAIATLGLLALGVASSRIDEQRAVELEQARLTAERLEADRERQAELAYASAREAYREAFLRQVSEARLAEHALAVADPEAPVGGRLLTALSPRVYLDQADSKLGEVLQAVALASNRTIVLEPSVDTELPVSVPERRAGHFWYRLLSDVARSRGLTVREPDATTLVLAQPRRVSLACSEWPLREAFLELGRQAGRRVHVEAGVQGSASVQLAYVPWNAAFRSLAAAHRLRVCLEGEVLRVGTSPPGLELQQGGIDGWGLAPRVGDLAAPPIEITWRTTLDEALAKVRPWAPARIVIRGEPDRFWRARQVNGEGWEHSLTTIGALSGSWVDVSAGWAHVQPQEPNLQTANDAPLSLWLAALARCADVSLVVGPGVEGRVDGSWSNRSYRAGLVADAEAAGLLVERDGANLYRVHVGDPSSSLSGSRRGPGATDGLRCSAVISTPQQQLAIVGGRLCAVGEHLTAGPDQAQQHWVVRAIGTQEVRLVNLDGGAEPVELTLR